MSLVDELIGKKTLYIQLFRIYEKELLNIFEYIQPVGENLNMFGNRIHELHLRVCSEIENIAKEVCYMIKPKNEVEKLMKDKREEEVRSGLKGVGCEDEDVIQHVLSKRSFSPFNHYLDFLDENLSICSKKIEKIYGVENYNLYDKVYKPDFYTPFERVGSGNVPTWRTNYNGIKHRKLETYGKCKLNDLILSFGGYYILLNYLYFGFDSIVENNGYMVNNILEYMKGGNNLLSNIFIPTCAFISYPIGLLANPNEQYINEKNVKDIDILVSSESNKLIIENLVNKKLDFIKEYLYYCSLKLIPTIGIKDLNMNLSTQESYKLKPFISFTNNGIEKISTSKIGVNQEEGEINYDVVIGYPTDYWKTTIVVGEESKQT